MEGRGVYNAIDDHQACSMSSKNQCSPGNVSDQSCPGIHTIGPSSRGVQGRKRQGHTGGFQEVRRKMLLFLSGCERFQEAP